MKISILAAAALLLAGTSMAQAAWDQTQTVLDLQAKGFTHIEITVGATQAKVEASNGTTKIETVYDLVTGDVVKTETEAADPGDSQRPGVEIKTTDDFTFIGGDDSEDDDNDDLSDDHGSDDDETDDNGSDDNSAPGGGDDDDDSGDDDSDDGDDDDGDDDNSGHGGGDDD